MTAIMWDKGGRTKEKEEGCKECQRMPREKRDRIERLDELQRPSRANSRGLRGRGERSDVNVRTLLGIPAGARLRRIDRTQHSIKAVA
jgi:hypothetical protein